MCGSGGPGCNRVRSSVPASGDLLDLDGYVVLAVRSGFPEEARAGTLPSTLRGALVAHGSEILVHEVEPYFGFSNLTNYVARSDLNSGGPLSRRDVCEPSKLLRTRDGV